MSAVLTWIENHPTTVSILQWGALIILAWVAGVFKWLRVKTTSPKLECVAPASFCFLELLGDFRGHPNSVRASFFVHASIINRSPEKVVVDRFRLGFKCRNMFRSMHQKLLRLAYPAWPRKRLGTGYKLMGAFFTEYGNEDDRLLSVSGTIEPKDIAAGYLLFVSNTYGSWNPQIENDHIQVKLNVTLSSGAKLTDKVRIRVTQDRSVAEEFVPGILEHISDESTWNHSI